MNLFRGEVERLKCDATADLCPDHRQNESEFFVECKAAGLDRGYNVYVANMEAYDEMLETYFPEHPGEDPEPRLLYVFYRHSVPDFKNFEYVSDLRKALAAHVEYAVVLESDIVKHIWANKVRNDRIRSYVNYGWEKFFVILKSEMAGFNPVWFLSRNHHPIGNLRFHASVAQGLKAHDLLVDDFPVFFYLSPESLAKPSVIRIMSTYPWSYWTKIRSVLTPVPEPESEPVPA